MDRNDLFLNKDYCEFYDIHISEQRTLTYLIEGNINRMCVCDTPEELSQQ